MYWLYWNLLYRNSTAFRIIKQLSQNSLEFNLESELVLFDCININKYLELDNSENSKKTILNYLQVLYASAYNYSNSIYNIAEMIKKIYNNVQNKDETQQEDVNEEIKNYLQVLENIREMLKKITMKQIDSLISRNFRDH